MQIQNLYENPLPVLKTDVEKIVININGIGEGFIHIKNVGGGLLSGEILSNTQSLIFEEKEFSGNDVILRYEVDTSSFSPGDRIMSNLVIISTGGEKNIPVVINVLIKPFVSEDNTEIFSLKEFYAYAKNKPIEARRILVSNDFLLWLKISGFEHMDVLEDIINDSDKERALDNFFVISGIKKKADISLEKSVYEYKIKNNSDDIINGVIKVKQNGLGYINANVYNKRNKEWLKVFCERLTHKDFDKDSNGEIYFEIDTNLINQKLDEEEIIIETDRKISVKIRVVKASNVNVRVEKICYDFEDEGEIFIENNFGEALVFEIKSNDNFIKFENEKYSIGKNMKIPFKIRVPSFNKNVMDIQKIPFVDGKIIIKTNYMDKEYEIVKKIIIGNSFL